MATQIYLIRHGETAWSLSGQHTGRTDIPLTKNGEFQATQLHDPLHKVIFNHVLSSPLQRAHRTCELAGFGQVAQLEPELQEWDYGAYESLTSAEIHVSKPNWNVFTEGCPQGESIDDVSRRADRMVTKLRALDGRVAVFSHGHFLCVLAMRWIGLPLGTGRHFDLDTGCLSILGYERPDEKVSVIQQWNASVTA